MPVSARAAQPAADAPPIDPDLSTEKMGRVGLLHVRPFGLLKDVGYDDNIKLEAESREGDTTATAGIGLESLLLMGDRGGIRLQQELDYVAFQRNTDLNHWNGASRARGILLLKRLSLSLEDRYNSERERPNNEIDQRLRRTNHALTGALRSLGQGRLAVKSYLRRERIDYASEDSQFDDVGQRLNREETTLTAVGELRVLPKTTLTLEGDIARIAFDDQDSERDTRQHTILPGVRFDPAALVQGELRAGPSRLVARERQGADYRGIVGDGRVSARLGRASRVKATLERDVEFSMLADNLYYVATGWSAAYEQFFSRHVSGEVSYGRGLNHYPKVVSRAGTPPFQGIRDDRLRTYQAAIRYRASAQMALEISAHRVRRDSTDNFYDRERNFYTFGTSISF